MVYRFGEEMNRSMTEDQFCQVVDAILNGKYSWACVLILKFAGYNPLQYIPYRTYNRLMKENDCHRHRGCKSTNSVERPLEVDNLPHIRNINQNKGPVKGGVGHYGILSSPFMRNLGLENGKSKFEGITF